jgi:ligand-binding SRPBCC domain-containing protein
VPTIKLKTMIHAPVDRCFDLARSIDLHIEAAGRTQERAVGGRTSGLIGLDETVTWRGKHFGLWHELTVAITAFDPPGYFQDTMTKGAFASMRHEHHFESSAGSTIMQDKFTFQSPLGPLGALADKLILKRYMRGFLTERNRVLKSVAESDSWRQFLRPEGL